MQRGRQSHDRYVDIDHLRDAPCIDESDQADQHCKNRYGAGAVDNQFFWVPPCQLGQKQHDIASQGEHE